MTTAIPDIGARLDRAFDTFSSVCISVRVRFSNERFWEDALRSAGGYAEQSESDDTHITYYLRPNYEDSLMRTLIRLGCMYGTVTLPETERGREIARGMNPSFLNASVVKKNLVRNRAFLGA